MDADIWLSSTDQLLVGQTPHTLSEDQTLQGLYLRPLLKMLQKHNTRSVSLAPDTVLDGEDMAGVFAKEPAQSLTLLLEFKGTNNAGERIWPRLVAELDSLRDAGYLTHFNGSALIQRPLTIVASGESAPFHRIQAAGHFRDIFYDAPLLDIAVEEESPYTEENTYYASADFRDALGPIVGGRFSQGQLSELRRQVRAAHGRGLKVRYLNTPAWPRGNRNHVWHVLVREGVDVISVDDLRDATRKDWRKRRSWLI